MSINKNGKPVAVVLSVDEYAQLILLKQERLKSELQKGIADINAGRIIEGKTVIDNLRQKLT